MRIVLIRHGATEWSRAGRHTGRTDIELLPEGAQAARALSPALAELLGAPPQDVVVYSSPLRRALETAKVLFGADRPIRTDRDLVEFDYGDYEGRTTAEIHAARPDWDLFRDGCPAGESPDDVCVRVDRFLAALPDAEAAVIVAHGHLLRILAARALGHEAAMGRVLALDPTTLSLIDDDRGRRVLRLWNLPPRRDGQNALRHSDVSGM
jgi:broad specificity phosphatase PhoE